MHVSAKTAWLFYNYDERRRGYVVGTSVSLVGRGITLTLSGLFSRNIGIRKYNA